MRVSLQENKFVFQNKDFWGDRLKKDKYFQQKIRIIKEIIPPSVRTILDVGCGDGSLTNCFTDEYNIIGCDLNTSGLNKVIGPKVLCNSAILPFRHRTFDLVISSQIIEHLPHNVYEKTLKELQRVTARYILVGVPYNEDLKTFTTRCKQCRTVYNIWGHIRSFRDFEYMKKLFPNFRLIMGILCGTLQEYPHPFSLFLRQRFLVQWRHEPTQCCPNCSSSEVLTTMNIHWRFERFMIEVRPLLTKKILPFLKKRFPARKDPFWMISLFERLENDC